MKKQDLVLPSHYSESLIGLPDKQLGKLVKALFYYLETGETPVWLTDIASKVCFEFIVRSIRENG